MKNMLKDYGKLQGMIFPTCENFSAICIYMNYVQHYRTNHVDLRHHFIKDLVEEKIVRFEFVPTELVNLFTKHNPNI